LLSSPHAHVPIPFHLATGQSIINPLVVARKSGHAGLSHCRPRFVLGRGVLAKSGAPTIPIIEHRDIYRRYPASLRSAWGSAMVHELTLERPQEIFDPGVSQQLPFRLMFGVIVSVAWWAIWIARFSWWVLCCRCFTAILFRKIVSPAPSTCSRPDSDQTARRNGV